MSWVKPDPHQGMLVHRDDGRYAHVPHCSEQCDGESHWLEADSGDGSSAGGPAS